MVCFVRLKQPEDFGIQELSFILSGCCEDLMFSLRSFYCISLHLMQSLTMSMVQGVE